jgi:hypothetical protein
MSGPVRVKGHTLRDAGKPFAHRMGSYVRNYDGWGYGLCSCGSRSPEPLTSDSARREWHRGHKASEAELAQIRASGKQPWDIDEDITGFYFRQAAKDHVMQVVHDRGPIKHLDFRTPGQAGIDSFQITTTPRHLTMTGDRGVYVFGRISDGISFFNQPGPVNTAYWAEKLLAADRPITEFDMRVLKWSLAEAAPEIEFDDILHPENTYEAYNELSRLNVHDFQELSVESFTPSYVWACHAVQWAARTYVASKTPDRDLPGSAS